MKPLKSCSDCEPKIDGYCSDCWKGGVDERIKKVSRMSKAEFLKKYWGDEDCENFVYKNDDGRVEAITDFNAFLEWNYAEEELIYVMDYWITGIDIDKDKKDGTIYERIYFEREDDEDKKIEDFFEDKFFEYMQQEA